MQLELDLLRFKDQLQVKRKDDKRLIFDPVRRKWLVLQPEEMVRQLMVCYLLEEKGYRKNRLSAERGLSVNNRQGRFDLLVYDEEVKPYLLVECKAPQIRVNQATFEQASWYNTTLKVPYLMVTNGMDAYCCAIDYEAKDYRYLNTVPDPA
jgi:hypothetical protein